VGETEADFDIYWKGIDDEGNGEPLLRAEGRQLPRSWSPDGKQLLYETQSVESGDDLWVLPLGEAPFPILNTAANERSGVFSPDGKFIAYVSDAADGNQIYVRPYPGPGRARRVSFEGGVEPFWPADGDKLIYRSANRKDMMSVAINTSSDGEIVELGDPDVVFSGSYTSYLFGGHNYSVSADGKRFLMLETADRGNTDTQLKLVLNWTEELERLVPKD
jgi:dipeptidyl aminopeptidase/acylaminoacyl peptidase